VPRILVADDNTNIQKMVSLAFEERGISVVSVGNGEAAVRRIPDLNPDLVLADVFMPVRNGYEVCEFVKKDERFSHVPVILLVGAFDPLDEREARRVGADGVLKKPFVPPDPLIAMVTSALEKNPKLAAELAKARETPKEPELPPMPILEAPTKREPAPLPDFPEPTPEEAAQIYGFGKGVRNIGDDLAKEGPAPVSVKKEEEEKEEFDGSSTTRDWRRTAGMDLEVPEGTTAGAEYDFGRGFTGGFAPQSQTAAQRSAATELDEIGEPVASQKEKESAPAFFAPSEPPAPPAPAIPPPPAPLAEQPASVPPPPAPQAAGPAAPSSPPLLASIPTIPAIPEAQFADEHTTFEEKEAQPQEHSGFESALPERPRHWMDMMAPAPAAEHPSSAWATQTAEPPAEAAAPAAEAASPASTPAPVSPEPETPFFAEEPAPSATQRGPKNEPWFSVPPPVHDVIQAKVHEVVQEVSEQGEDARPAPDFGHEIVISQGHADPAGEGHVEADHVTSAIKSLFANDSASEIRPAPSQFGSGGRDSGPSYHFPEPEAEQAFEPAEEEPHDYSNASSSPAQPESEPAIFSERIPTGPPPNREALADIPFLQPPPPPPSPNPEAVDAVVARVLEKLGPQLQDLLSKGVLKPLVENLLQQELEKKEK
jgi:CheY-like chemotaxis protein